MNNTHVITSHTYAVRQPGNCGIHLRSFFSVLWPGNWFANKRKLQGQLTANSKEIARLKWELLQRNEQLRNITYYQSHTVRRPLANILGIAELIAADTDTQRDASMAELISLLRISADELDKAIKNNSKGV